MFHRQIFNVLHWKLVNFYASISGEKVFIDFKENIEYILNIYNIILQWNNMQEALSPSVLLSNIYLSTFLI